MVSSHDRELFLWLRRNNKLFSGRFMYHNRIKKRIELVGIKNGTLAALVGLQAPKLSIWLKGRCELPPAMMKKIDGTLSDLVSLQKCFPVLLKQHVGKKIIGLDCDFC